MKMPSFVLAIVSRWICAGILGFAFGNFAVAAESARIGEVAFAIGVAHVTNVQGATVVLRRGTALFEGQRIETGENGHVHIRFIDGASVAVRPESRLLIQEYHYDAARPADNRVRFLLEQGEARSITGKAGEAAKDRFRLNTPIAAIGIKGTDFIVQVTPAETRVFVQSGAIVMAPLNGSCRAESLGACSGEHARELSAQMAGHFLRLSAQNPLPELLVIEHRSGSARANNPMDKGERFAAPDPQAQVALASERADGLAVTTATAPPIAIATGPHIVPGMENVVPRLWWGRFPGYDDPAVPQSSYTNQLNVPGREFGAGNSVFGMLRENATVFIMPRGTADFNLASYEAYLVNGLQLTPVAVSGASLSINFDAGRFTTSLGVAGQQLNASGSFGGDGRFLSTPGSATSVFGAVVSGGGQAGYTFQHDLSPGRVLSGATLWSR